MPDPVNDPTFQLLPGTIYHFDIKDQFVPTPQQAGPLTTNLENPVWGTTPLDYVTWFNRIWHTGDPSQWGPEVFTRDAVMIDSTGTSTGGAAAASDFLLLFKYFPSLRGEVASWAHNDTEILINWRFVISKGRVVPVLDKFCFINGLVSFRVAYFDTVTFLSYLAENHGSAPLVDYFVDRWRSTETRGGLLYLPSLVAALIKGVFLWSRIPLPAPRNVQASVPAPGTVRLTWDRVEGANTYRVKRSNVTGGPYTWIEPYTRTTTFDDDDKTAKPGTRYFYVVSTNDPNDPDPRNAPATI